MRASIEKRMKLKEKEVQSKVCLAEETEAASPSIINVSENRLIKPGMIKKGVSGDSSVFTATQRKLDVSFPSGLSKGITSPAGDSETNKTSDGGLLLLKSTEDNVKNQMNDVTNNIKTSQNQYALWKHLCLLTCHENLSLFWCFDQNLKIY